ncbi:MAG: folate-binding protein [Proteobacteria bacterium]|nr:folate-binding protein [Pseudomonadota bacterium]
MNAVWHSFLLAHGASIGQAQAVSFGDAARKAAVQDTIITDLSHLGLISVAGADAAVFLQGQLSNDLNQVTETRSQLSAWCSAKGRVLALMRVFKRADTYYLQLPRDILEATLKRLRMYVLRSQVTLHDASDTFIGVGLSGAGAPALLTRALDTIPPPASGVLHSGDALTLLGLPGTEPRFAIIAGIETAQDLWRRCAGAATPDGGEVWSLLDIRAGLPAIHSATQDMFIPQMINLDLIGAVSFTKGCYPGQEIVARTQHLGSAKRRMYYACARAAAPPVPGATLYSTQNGQAIGQVIEAAPGPAEDVELLAVVPIADVVDQHVSLHSAGGPTLRFIKLPYSGVIK